MKWYGKIEEGESSLEASGKASWRRQVLKSSSERQMGVNQAAMGACSKGRGHKCKDPEAGRNVAAPTSQGVLGEVWQAGIKGEW